VTEWSCGAAIAASILAVFQTLTTPAAAVTTRESGAGATPSMLASWAFKDGLPRALPQSATTFRGGFGGRKQPDGRQESHCFDRRVVCGGTFVRANQMAIAVDIWRRKLGIGPSKGVTAPDL
jgi:hypothetical protein